MATRASRDRQQGNTVLVVGATGTIGAPTVRALVSAGADVRVLVRDAAKARRMFHAAAAPEIIAAPFDDDAALDVAFARVRGALVALGARGEQGRLQRIVIDAAARNGLPYLLRLSVLNASPRSLGANQRAHAELEGHAALRGLTGTALRPAIFDTNVLEAADAIRATDGWVGGAPAGRQAFIDPRDVAAVAMSLLVRSPAAPAVLELTGPELYSYTEVASLLTAEVRRAISYRTVDENTVREDQRRRGFPDETIAMHIQRDRAIQAGENARLSPAVRQITGREPRGLMAFIHEHRAAFSAIEADAP